MANLRDITDFIADIEGRDPEGRSITQSDFADILQSLAKTGGTLNVNNAAEPFTIVAGRNRIEAFDRAIDTQGVSDGLGDVPPTVDFRVTNAGAGDYSVNASIRFSTDTDGVYILEIGQMDNQGNKIANPYKDTMQAIAGVTMLSVLSNCLIKGVEGGSRLYLEMVGVNGASVTVYSGQFGIQR